jgi:hypothetical protein
MKGWQMRYDQRRSRRNQVNQYARIVGANGSTASFCTMLDVSASGARLRLNDIIEVPEQFTLLLSRNGQVRRRCKLVWQRGDEVGVLFAARERRRPIMTRSES